MCLAVYYVNYLLRASRFFDFYGLVISAELSDSWQVKFQIRTETGAP